MRSRHTWVPVAWETCIRRPTPVWAAALQSSSCLEAFTHDSERVGRFRREARVLASLNHPNIAAIHGFEEAEGRNFLVMELAEGETLAERIRAGSIPVEEALGIAAQIAEGLEAAHERGIAHRDLKPANVKITPGGRVKVLDFGLAKAFETEKPIAPSSPESTTISSARTREGVNLRHDSLHVSRTS